MRGIRNDRHLAVFHAAKAFLTRYWPPMAWMAVIFATSCTRIGSRAFVHFVATESPAKMTERQFGSFWNGHWWLFVKGYHMLEYFVLALLLARRGPRSIWACAAIAMAYAATDEWHQTFVPYRGGRWTDVMIDWGGVLLAVGASVAVRHARASRIVVGGALEA